MKSLANVRENRYNTDKKRESRCEVMIPPVPYKGEKPYIFISYAHKDSDRVWPIVARLQLDGYRVWYDEGIDPGTEWDENIASHVKKCGYFIAFLSESYLQSDNCKDELNFARDLEKKQVLVYLEDVELPAGMALRFGRFQNFRADRPGFFGRLYEAEGIKNFTTGKKTRSKKWLIAAGLAAAAVIAAALILPGLLREEPEPPATEPALTQPTEDPHSFKQTTFFSSAGVKLTAREFYYEEGWGGQDLILECTLENTGSEDRELMISECYVNGYRCFPSSNFTAGANSNEVIQLRWTAESLAEFGPKDLTYEDIGIMEGRIRVEGVSDPVRFVYYPYGKENAVGETYVPQEDDIILVDNGDCQVILTDWFYDEDGLWRGDFVSVNLTDRMLSVMVSLETVNGYNIGRWWTDDIRPGCALHYMAFAEDWEHSQQEKVLQIDGYVHLSDPDTKDQFGDTEFTIRPEGGEIQEFPPRRLTEEDIILVDNKYAKVAVIDSAPYNSAVYTYTVYCYNPSDRTYHVTLDNLTENGTNRGSWSVINLGPGEQGLRTFNYFHEGNASSLEVTCDVRGFSDSYEAFKESVQFDFEW